MAGVVDDQAAYAGKQRGRLSRRGMATGRSRYRLAGRRASSARWAALDDAPLIRPPPLHATVSFHANIQRRVGQLSLV